MAPTKGGITKNSFELSDEDWSGEKGAIDWTADAQQPSKNTNGYVPDGRDTKHMRTVPLAETPNDKYSSEKDGERQWTGTTNIEQEQARLDEGKEAGVGLTSTVSEDLKNSSKANALVTFTDNHASLSGGAFGTDGNVMFATPFTMSWSKAKATEANGNATVETNADRLAGSEWKLSTTNGGPFEPNMRPVECLTESTDVPDSCWHNLSVDNGEKWVIIADNGSRDNDKTDGDISINNLKPGTYTLTEHRAPANYQPTANQYTFTITRPDAGEKYEEPALTLKTGSGDTHDGNGPLDGTGKVIGNRPDRSGVSWDKIDLYDQNGYLSGSTWKITDADGTAIAGYDNITDNTGAQDYQGKDTNTGAGHFTVAGLSRNASYKLCEVNAPSGYVKPTGESACHAFGIGSDGLVTWGANGEATSEGRITNTPTEVAWTKVDGSQTNTVLPGSEWSIATCKDTDADCATVEDGTSHAVVDCASANCPVSGDGTQYKDADPRPGHITVRALPAASYKLTETKAPKDYHLPDANTTYAVITIAQNGAVTMTLHGEWSNAQDGAAASCTVSGASVSATGATASGAGCALPNVKAISALPFTGGMTGTDWLLAGGVLALAAAATGWFATRSKRRLTR